MTVPSVPEWLDRTFLESVLGEEVQEMVASPAAPPGNNYGSFIIRVSVQLKNKKDRKSLIIKSELAEGEIKDNFDLTKPVEYDFYYRFLPAAEKFTSVSFAPKSFTSPLPNTVVLEDLKELGFEMADRCEQLDFAHCELYAIAAAKFHAVSLAVIKSNPDIVEPMVEEKLYSNELKAAGFIKRMIAQGTKCFLDATANIAKFKKAHDIVASVRDRLWDMLVDLHSRDEKNINTINQGDPWTTNMMFKYDESRNVVDIRILDFQALRVGSPINDLITFLWGSGNHDVKDTRIPELYKIYLDHFNRHLKDFGCSETLTYDAFMERVKRLSPLILMMFTSHLPLTLDPVPIAFEEFMRDDDFYKKYYHEKFCTYHMPRLIDQMETSGVLENIEIYSKEFS